MMIFSTAIFKGRLSSVLLGGKEKKRKRKGWVKSFSSASPRLAAPLTLVSNCAQSLSYFGSLSAYVAMEFISDAKAL